MDAFGADCVTMGMQTADTYVHWDASSGRDDLLATRASITEILSAAEPGDRGVVERLLPLVYAEMRMIAGRCLRARAGASLQPTELVHEAYMRLVGSDQNWQGREHFMATAAMAMRQILVDHARRRRAAKRGGHAVRATINLDGVAGQERDEKVLDLDALLTLLQRADPRAASVSEMRLFGGMTHEQIAVALGVSRNTVANDWQFAKAWLASRASRDG